MHEYVFLLYLYRDAMSILDKLSQNTLGNVI